MSALTSLLARDQIVPLRRIEEALQKQVLSGGDIAAVLLELDAIPENTLAAYSAALFGLLPATRDEVMRAPRDVIRLVPREVAEKHRIIPLGVDGTNLLCALAAPLSGPDESQLAFLLGHSILARVVCDVRISAALLHHYGVEPAARHKRLIERLRERDAGAIPYVAPPPSGKVSAGALSALGQKAKKSSWLDESDDEPSSAAASVPSAIAEGRATSPMGIPRSLPVSVGPAAPRVSEAPSSDDERLDRTTFPIGSDRVTDVGAAPPPAQPGGPAVFVRPIAAARPLEPAPPPESSGREALAPIPPSSALPKARAERVPTRGSDSSSALVSAARRHRGPLTPAAAVRLLDEADGRDAVLDVLFSFARQFFDYSAVFAMHDDFAEGREAYGPGATTEEIKRVRVALALPGVLADARERRAPVVAALDAREADRALTAQLGRPGAGPALLLPIAIKNRVVLVLYADRAGDSFEPSDVPELLAIAPRVASALERIILRKKSKASDFGRPVAASVKDDLKAAVRGASEAARGQLPRERRSLDRWAPAERTSAVPAPSGATGTTSAGGWARGGTGGAEGSKAAAPPSASPAVAVRAPAVSDVPRSLADAALEEPTEPIAPVAPRAAPQPSAAEIRAALGPRGLLGIPRSAPPPPSAHVPGLGPTALENVGRDTLPEGLLPARGTAGPVQVRSKLERVRAPEPPPDDDEPDVEVSVGSDDDDEPDLSIETSDGDDGDDDAAAASEGDEVALDTHTTANAGVATASAYLVRDASIEVVAPRGRKTISSRPPPPGPALEPEPALLTKRRSSEAPKAKRDPRAEDDGAVPDAEVVHVRPGARAAAAPTSPLPAKPSNPPRAATGPRDVPSVIVDMGETVSSLVIDLQHAGPDDERALVEALLRLGDAALPVLAQAFPGPLWFDRRRPHRRVPRGRDVSAICRALFAFGLRATPYVATLVGSSAAERRYYALLLAGEMIHPSMLEAIAGRLFDEDDGVRKLAQEVFPRFRGIAGYDEQLVAIRRAARIRGKVARRRTDALAALGAARDVGALDLCVELLEDEDQNVARAAHVVLVALSCDDVGPSMRKWAQWVDKNRGRNRVEWLIDALVGNDEPLRTAAGDELKALTQQYFGFHPSAPRREREVAQQKYRAWWTAEGKKQFG